jgi:hypothetical protein
LHTPKKAELDEVEEMDAGVDQKNAEVETEELAVGSTPWVRGDAVPFTPWGWDEGEEAHHQKESRHLQTTPDTVRQGVVLVTPQPHHELQHGACRCAAFLAQGLGIRFDYGDPVPIVAGHHDRGEES